jgi:hypothetical protein
MGLPVPVSWLADSEVDTAPGDLNDWPVAADSTRVVVTYIEPEPSVEFMPLVVTVVAGSTVIVPCIMT